MPLEAAHGLCPAWAADARVGAWMSLRGGGVSEGPFASLNLGRSAGDAAGAVEENRRRFAASLGVTPRWMSQVHGTRVLRLAALHGRLAPTSLPAPAAGFESAESADAAITTVAGVACTVMVADCLPVLLAAPAGRGVGATHAGWRGLAAGVLEASVAALANAAACRPDELVAWLGPCIGPHRFEVGAEVVDAFKGGPRFVERPRADGALRWLADLPGLATDRLRRAGLTQISASGLCTHEDASRFFSYRRDGATGRMAVAVWLRG